MSSPPPPCKNYREEGVRTGISGEDYSAYGEYGIDLYERRTYALDGICLFSFIRLVIRL